MHTPSMCCRVLLTGRERRRQLPLSGRIHPYDPDQDTLKAMMQDAGFESVDTTI